MEIKLEGRYAAVPSKLVDRLCRFLWRIDYKKEWAWVVNAVDQDCVMIGLKFPIIDVVTGSPSTLNYFHPDRIFIYDMERLVDEYLLEFAYRTILGAEKHESDEWFKFDGVKIYDPHREGA